MDLSREIDKVLIVSIIPYFLERENFWFEKNLKKILEARKTQIFWQENTLFLEKNLKMPFSFLLRKLDEMGYEKVWQVSQIGEFSQRGGIVDVFPINLNFAIRIEFWGNKIENIFRLPIEIEDEKKEKEILKKRLKSQKIFSDLRGLKPGDYIVHLDHGIGIYNGQLTMNKEQYYVLEYAQGDKLYVPFGLERKLSRYMGFSEPKISRLGTLTWIKTKKKVKEEVERFARELLKIYAKREIVTRPPYLKSEMVKYLKETFPFEETPDQEKAIEDIEKDLEKERPMDRLICGDVGFGKTEVALRAMVRVVESGYQAVMLCPTTILANQHYQNFKKRLKNLPIEVGILTRIQTKREQKETIKKLKEGKIDILVGTHRILSKDVEFKKLGLLVVDDEHKFGVRQKEKLKKLRAELDVLSLSATPIPRTLYLSLSGLREISLIQTPPPGRLPIKTFILPFSEKVIKEAIEKELKRGGASLLFAQQN
jgi:transcription-repair coupling factor (superfamily II helicase)